MLKQILIRIAVILAIWLFLLLIYGAYSSVRPKKFISKITPANHGLEYENVTFKSGKLSLRGWFVPNNKSDDVIVLCHGYPFDKGSLLFLTFLHKEHNLFFFDFRYFGESEGAFTSVGYHEQRDFEAALKYLRKRGFKKIGAWGVSMGAAVILTHDDVDAIVVDSPFATLDSMIHMKYRQFGVFRHPFVFLSKRLGRLAGINTAEVAPIKSVKDIDAPILIIHGEKDEEVPLKEVELLHDAAKNSELWIVPGAIHAEASFTQKEEYEKRVTEFFDKNL